MRTTIKLISLFIIATLSSNAMAGRFTLNHGNQGKLNFNVRMHGHKEAIVEVDYRGNNGSRGAGNVSFINNNHLSTGVTFFPAYLNAHSFGNNIVVARCDRAARVCNSQVPRRMISNMYSGQHTLYAFFTKSNRQLLTFFTVAVSFRGNNAMGISAKLCRDTSTFTDNFGCND